MQALKKCLAAVLAAVMLFTLLPSTALAEDPGIMPMSMQPLKEKTISISLKEEILLPSELSAVKISDILSLAKAELTDSDSDIKTAIDNTTQVAWVESNSSFSNSNDSYTISAVEDTIDLTPSGSGTMAYLKMIVGGSTEDQLATNNIRLLLTVNVNNNWNDIIKFKVENSDGKDVLFSQYYYSSYDPGEFYLTLDEDQVSWGDQVKLSMDFTDGITFTGIDVKVYEGYYKTAEEITADTEAEDIADQIWGSAAFGYKSTVGNGYSYYTIQFTRDGVVSVLPLSVYMNRDALGVSTSAYNLYTSAGTYMGSSSIADYKSEYDYDYGYNVRTIVIYLKQQALDDAGYRYKASIYDPQTTKSHDYDVDYVECAVVGDQYYTVAQAKQLVAENGANDIKDALFSSSASSAYLDDFSDIRYFTVVLKDREYQDDDYPELFGICVEKYEEPEQEETEPTTPPLNSGTNFYINSVYINAAEGSSTLLTIYNSSSKGNDSYDDVFQTVFLRKQDGSSLDKGDTITAYFSASSGTKVYLDGKLQENNVSEITFESGKAFHYTVAAENGTDRKEYWVTFLTPQDNAELFVNGASVNDVTVENLYGNSVYDGDAELPVREIHVADLTVSNGNNGEYHDILIANLGKDNDLTGLYVQLLDADKKQVDALTNDAGEAILQLDPYWTILEDGTKTLGKFDALDSSGVTMHNLAKIRLTPGYDDEGNVAYGEIDGYLVIGAEGTGDPVTIKLTGITGSPKITSDDIDDGVKYVPYDNLLGTNNIGDTNALRFELGGGSLPSGVTLYPNGDIYGVPMEDGEYTFVVNLYAAKTGNLLDSATFTLTIKLNTDDNVWNASDAGGYSVLDYVGVPATASGNDVLDGTAHYVLTSYTEQLFRSEGEYNIFVDFYLDGVKQVLGTDYDAESGSTKITIRSQTLQNAGTGTHTIAAEFRTTTVDGTPYGTTKSTSQNYTVALQSSTYPSGTSSSQTSNQITTSTTANGTAATTTSTAKPGDQVTITTSPDEGYRPGRVTVTDSNGNIIPVTDNGDGTYTFTMPATPVTISVTFVPIVSSWANPFTDVYESDWFHDSVKFVYENDIMTGTSATTFEPFAASLRNMIVTVLWRIEGSPNTNYPNSFTDVPENSWYTDAVRWAAENGIVQGYGNGALGATDALTREQMVCMLYRYAVYNGLDVADSSDNLSTFTDSDKISDYAVEAMNWAIGTGILKGKGQGFLDARGGATRAELAAIVERFCKLSDELADEQRDPQS